MFGRILGVTLVCLMVLVATYQTLALEQAVGETRVRFTDARGDDVGGGDLLYPNHAVYVPGLFDLVQFEVSFDEQNIFFDFQFVALTNPFQAPEGYFHQRLEVYMLTGEPTILSDIRFGAYTLPTAQDAGWNVRLSIAPFDESRLYVLGEDGRVQVFSEEVTSFSLPERKTVRAQVKRDVLPQPNPAWGYYVLVGSFDGLAEGSWRDLGDGPWQVGGQGIPVFDLLSPRFGRKSQKAQLSQGVLYPVYQGEIQLMLVLFGALLVAGAVGVFCLWRWRHGRS
jgi:carbohydrate-binding DOMON domain-containing protein